MNIQSLFYFINKICTRDNLTLILSVFGTLGTLCTLFSKRRNFSISAHYYNYKNESLLMYVAFTNKSQLPITITNVSLVIDSVCYPCAYVPTKVIDYTHRIGKEIVSHKELMSIQFPISLAALAGTSGYLYFDTLPSNYPNTPSELTLEVSTSRGKAKRIKLSVPTY